MIKIIAIVAILLIVAFLLYAATKPNIFKVQRSIGIQALPDKIFPLINSLKEMAAWSPYEKLDPTMSRTFSGPDAGPGATYEWQGNNKIGTGKLAIVDSSPSSLVTMQLDMYKPMEGHNVVDFTLTPSGDSTEVTWAMQGRSSYLSKLMVTLGAMDKMVGGQFEEGLSNLKRLAESH